MAFSVLVQGSLVPGIAAKANVPMCDKLLRPWDLDIRLSTEPHGLTSHTVSPGSPAHGATVRAIHHEHNLWVSLLSRDGQLVPLTGDIVLQPGDEIFVQIGSEAPADPRSLFGSTEDAVQQASVLRQ